MFSLRRSALRIISSTPASSFVYQPRTITTLTQSFLKAKPASQFVYQRRWASDAANAEEVPVSKLQPTPQEEVENAIHEDEAKVQEVNGGSIHDGDSIQASSAAVDAEVQDTPVPMEPPAPEDVGSRGSEGSSQRFSLGSSSDSSMPDRRDRKPELDQRIHEPKATLYIGNLFFDVTEDDLKKELARFGEVVSVRLLRDARGLSKGFGYVDMRDTESATSAIKALHQEVFEGRRLVVQYAAYTTEDLRKRQGDRSTATNNSFGAGPKNPPSRTLFIGNMSYEMTDRDLNALFRGIRNVVDVRVAIDRRTGTPRGFAHADFVDVKSAMEAMKILSDKDTYGRKLRLDYSFSNNAPKNDQKPPPVEEPM